MVLESLLASSRSSWQAPEYFYLPFNAVLLSEWTHFHCDFLNKNCIPVYYVVTIIFLRHPPPLALRPFQMEIIINTKVPLPEIEFSTSNRRFPEPAGWLIPRPLSDIRINQLCIAIKVRHRTSSSAVASLQPAPSTIHHRAVIHTLRISYSTPNTTILLCLPVSATAASLVKCIIIYL